MNVKSKISIFIASLFICSCNSYKNKDSYEITIGETVEIYYTTNACCYFCLSNENEIKHLKLLDRKVISGGLDNCSGCDYFGFFVFKAESVGIDTIELKQLEATDNCDRSNIKPERYIVNIR